MVKENIDSKIKKICPTCRKIFYVFLSLKRRRFCSRKCKRYTKKAREKISFAMRRAWVKNPHPSGTLGKTAWNKGLKGMHFSPETEFKPGDKHIFWQGGISKEPYSFNFTKELKSYIKHYYLCKCWLCGNSMDLIVHHIDYDKKNGNIDNLISLCRSCHSKTNYNRSYWIKLFNCGMTNRREKAYLDMLTTEDIPANCVAYGVPIDIIREK